MKSFLISFLICTSATAAHLTPPRGGVVLGTIQMWSDWYPAAAQVDIEQVCKIVRDSYNQMNLPRGYWGRLLAPKPVHFVTQNLASGEVVKQFFCHLRVKKFDLDDQE